MKPTTLNELNTLGVDENIPILAPGPDHSYRPVKAKLTTAMYHPKWGWSEDYGELNPPELEAEATRITVLVVE